MLEKNNSYHKHVTLIEEPLLPCDIKAVIGKLDMLITGRVHASVASTSQCIPTVYMEYDRRIIYSDKMLGFSEQLEMQRFVAEPGLCAACRQQKNFKLHRSLCRLTLLFRPVRKEKKKKTEHEKQIWVKWNHCPKVLQNQIGRSNV